MSRKSWPQNVGYGTDDRAGVHRDIRPYEKSVYLLVCSPATKAFFTEFRQTSPSRLKFSKSHDIF